MFLPSRDDKHCQYPQPYAPQTFKDPNLGHQSPDMVHGRINILSSVGQDKAKISVLE